MYSTLALRHLGILVKPSARFTEQNEKIQQVKCRLDKLPANGRGIRTKKSVEGDSSNPVRDQQIRLGARINGNEARSRESARPKKRRKSCR